jgi:hypothetical protein
MAAGGGDRPSVISAEAVSVLLAASSVDVKRGREGSSRRRFFLAGISTACGNGDNGTVIVCGGDSLYYRSDRFAAFRSTVNVPIGFWCGPSLTVSSAGMTEARSFGCSLVGRILHNEAVIQ